LQGAGDKKDTRLIGGYFLAYTQGSGRPTGKHPKTWHRRAPQMNDINEGAYTIPTEPNI
jgi:hypothetical protein